MKKQHLFPLLALVLLASGLASAQLDQRAVKANVPFSFMAGKTALPAGDYRVSTLSDVGVLGVQGDSGSVMVGSHAVQGNAPSRATKLIFHRYGDQYFLSQIWVEGESRGRELPRTNLEKELLAKARFNAVAILAHK
ncbi:MAG TPA: hypothetical protein VMT53_15380 [Terriglobales bacterium]|nr:hypothetical protein [Terriglobales bacterium]